MNCREIFEEVRIELGVAKTLPSVDVETRWFSTFDRVSNAYKSLRVINAVIVSIEELAHSGISNAEWDMCKEICRFIEGAASVKEKIQVLSRSRYV